MTENSGRVDQGSGGRSAELSSTWVTVGLVLLAAPNLAAGAWGLLAPEHWFDNFPGWAPRLVAAFAPFNEHLVSDAAAGLFAAGLPPRARCGGEVDMLSSWRWRPFWRSPCHTRCFISPIPPMRRRAARTLPTRSPCDWRSRSL